MVWTTSAHFRRTRGATHRTKLLSASCSGVRHGAWGGSSWVPGLLASEAGVLVDPVEVSIGMDRSFFYFGVIPMRVRLNCDLAIRVLLLVLVVLVDLLCGVLVFGTGGSMLSACIGLVGFLCYCRMVDLFGRERGYLALFPLRKSLVVMVGCVAFILPGLLVLVVTMAG